MQKLQNSLNKFLESKKVFWITLILIFVIVRMAVWFYPYDSDHWIFYYVGRAIAQGKLLYVDAWDHKPPLIFEFNALMHLLFGGNLILHRIFLTILALLDIFLFYKLANIFTKEFFKKNAEKVTRIALLLYVFWRSLAQFASSGNNTENIGVIFLLLMFLTFFKFYKDKKLTNLFLSGICLSVLFYLKPNFSVLSLPILVEILLLSYKSIKKFIVNYFVFGAAFLLQTTFWVLYFNSQNALKDFWIASFAFSSAYAKSAWGGNVSPQSIFIFIMLPLLAPLAIFTINFLKDFKKIKTSMLYRFLLFALAGGLFIGFGIGSFYPYYFLIAMPIFMLVMTYGIFRHPEWSKDLLDKPTVKDSSLVLQKSLRMTTIVILLGGMGVSFAMSSKQLLNSFRGPVKSQLNEYQQIADYIKSNSNTNDKIVFYDYGAVMYRMAERDSGSRFISASVLLLDTRDNYGFNLDDTFINDLKKSKPKYWIISKDENNIYYQNKKIILYMLNNFTLNKEFGNYMVLKNKDFYKE
ncbi:MAG: glycosyltransferase family 39 protein [bacterium]|nr:glycosyltransferase family 39 protein [bacterium]